MLSPKRDVAQVRTALSISHIINFITGFYRNCFSASNGFVPATQGWREAFVVVCTCYSAPNCFLAHTSHALMEILSISICLEGSQLPAKGRWEEES